MQLDVHPRQWLRVLVIGGVLGLMLRLGASAGSDVSAAPALPWLRIGEGSLLLVVSVLLIMCAILYLQVRKNAKLFAEYRRAEAALRESEQRYRSLVECSPDPIAVHCDGHLVFVNSAAVTLLGAQAEADLIGKPVLEVVHPDSKEIVSTRIQHALRTGVKLPLLEEKFQRLDGTDMDVEVTSMPLRYQGKPALQVVVRDISERKQAEQRLRDSEERYRAFAELVSDFAYVLRVNDDRSFGDEWVSESFMQVTGYSVAEARAMNWIGLLHPDDVQRIAAGIPGVLAGASSQAELRIVTKDQRVRWLHVYSHPAWDAGRTRVVKVYGAAQDITARKQAEMDIRAAHQEAERANKAKDLFLANISHELRTPLNAILGYAQLLERSVQMDVKEREEIRTIRRSAEHLLDMINEILDFSKIDAHKIELDLREFSFADFLRNVIDMVQIYADQQEIVFQPEIAEGLPDLIVGDERRLRQVLLNLLNNAVKFTEAGTVTLRVQRCLALADNQAATQRVAWIRFQVEDQGVGIAPDDLPDLFRPFQQIGDKRFYAQGVGLGLAISQRFVVMMGGELHVASVPGQGSTFWFELAVPEITEARKRPKLPAQRIIGMRRSNGKQGQDGPDAAAPPLSVLIVDDNRENRKMVRDILEPLGCVVLEAAHGLAAIECVASAHPDVIFMDLMMPVMDGLEATRRIRQNAGNHDIVIVGVSANVGEDVEQACFEAGCQAFLAKPFQVATLLQYVQRHAPIAWVYADAVPARDNQRPAAAPGVKRDQAAEPPPPAEIVSALYEAANGGDIVILREQVRRLHTQPHHYPQFLGKVDAFLRSYQMNKLTQFLAAYLERSGARSSERAKPDGACV